MTNSDGRERNAEDRHEFIKQWAEYVRTHDDEEWARQQHEIVNSQLRAAKELAASGATDPADFYRRKDQIAGKGGDRD